MEINKDGLFEFKEFISDPKQEPIRIDKFIISRMADISRSKVQKAIEDKLILVNGDPIKTNYKIRPGDKIVVYSSKEPVKYEVLPEDIPLDIVYEDEDVMVINKPPGLVVHPGVGNYTGTLVNALAFYFNEKNLPVKDGNTPDKPGIVHRIDKDTSGLMLIGKTELALTELGKQFYDHSIERKYQAIVWGNFDLKEGTIDEYIDRDPKNRLKRTVFPERNQGKFAITHYKVLEDFYYVSLVECQLETGRTHQIRVHMNYVKHPLFNDKRYGGDKILKGTVFTKYRQFVENNFKICPRQALHAKSIGFVHPRTKKEMFFESELPSDMADCLERWKKYLNNRK